MKRLLIPAMIFLYAITVAFGIPAVTTSYVEKAASEHTKVVKASRGDEGSKLTVGATFTLPLLPFVVLSWQHHQVAPLNGEGGLYASAWYILGVRSVQLWGWVS
jgi:hypothetical protein